MSDERIRLEVLGLSRNPIQTGAFALILAQKDGPYRIPIVIGTAEAQSIAIELERIITPRPITHDLFCSFSHAFGIELVEVYIYQFKDGIFSAQLTFSNGEQEVKLDSRTSDAIAIAVRTGSPIYTTREIMEETGTVIDNGNNGGDDNSPRSESKPADTAPATAYERMTDEQLEAALNKLIQDENYEEAAKVNEIIKSRK